MDYNLGEHIYSKRVINKLENKIKLANKKIDIYTYLDIKYLSSILIFVLSLCTFKVGYILGPIITIIYYNLYEYIILDKQIKKRIKKLEYEMLVFLDALILALESGKNIENSLEIVIFSLDNEISYEFKKTLFEMKFGKSLIESLESMKKRIPSNEINNVITGLIESMKYGNDIIETLYRQIDFLRNKQIYEIKGEINKIPNKISIVSVIFILPIIILLILGPVLIKFIG